MKDLKRTLVSCFTSVAVVGATIGIYVAVHSPLFLVQVVEIADQPEGSPLDAQAITQLAAIPAGIVNLFDLDLKAVEKRVLTNHWIREVRLQKRFPQTLSVGISFREPLALFQGENGVIAYVDSEGLPFGQLNLRLRSDLPLLSGFNAGEPGRARIRGALSILEAWGNSSAQSFAQVSTLSWHPQYGYRALVSYSIGSSKVVESVSSHENRPLGRVMVSLGQDIDGNQIQLRGQLGRLAGVFRYLSENSIQARQVFADVGKKVVVKTSRGS